MIQTSYYHKIDSVESQKAYMEEHQIKEEEIQLLKEQIQLQEQELQIIIDHADALEDTLNELIDYMKSQEHSQEISKSDVKSLERSSLSDTNPESLDEVPNCSDVSADEPDNP